MPESASQAHTCVSADRIKRWAETWLALALGAAGVGAVILLGHTGWPGTTVDCTATLCFCEALLPEPWRQPANTWSNLAPLLVAVAVGADASRRRHRARAASPAVTLLGFAFPVMLVFQGLGAMFFHASIKAWAGMLDASSMFNIVGLLLASNLARATRLRPSHMLGLWLAVILLGLGIGWRAPEMVSPVMFVFFISVLSSEVWLGRHRKTRSDRWFRLGLWIFLVGVVTWFASAIEGTPLCDPASLLQGHALWHVTSAVAIGLFWVHARLNLEPQPGETPRR